MKDDVIMIPINQIRILNPRSRDKTKFAQIVQNIQNVGLKKPIQVSRRSSDENEGAGYDLVCGQGRMEAFQALGFKEIPAIVVEISKEERLLRSLVENMARRFPSPMALMLEIERLKSKGYTISEIGRKLDMSDTTVSGYIILKKAGEERLMDAAIQGKIPIGVAMEIARADTVELQRGLLQAYENNQLTQVSIRTVKRLIDQRRLLGKQRASWAKGAGLRSSAESLVSAYRKESQKQKLIVKKSHICDAKLVFVVRAFNKLLANETFVNLLRTEGLSSLPEYLKQNVQEAEVAK